MHTHYPSAIPTIRCFASPLLELPLVCNMSHAPSWKCNWGRFVSPMKSLRFFILIYVIITLFNEHFLSSNRVVEPTKVYDRKSSASSWWLATDERDGRRVTHCEKHILFVSEHPIISSCEYINIISWSSDHCIFKWLFTMLRLEPVSGMRESQNWLFKLSILLCCLNLFKFNNVHLYSVHIQLCCVQFSCIPLVQAVFMKVAHDKNIYSTTKYVHIKMLIRPQQVTQLACNFIIYICSIYKDSLKKNIQIYTKVKYYIRIYGIPWNIQTLKSHANLLLIADHEWCHTRCQHTSQSSPQCASNG